MSDREHPTPLVSVIIPTLRRPQLVLRAMRSVLDQSHSNLELIVVVDGPDPATVDALAGVADARFKLISNPSSLGAGGARNAGADAAAGEWLAFLDDDDEWLPDKLRRQLELASDEVLVTCLCRVTTPNATYIWPRYVFDNSIPVDEYIFDRRSIFMGTTFIQTSTYLLRKELFQKVRFKLRREMFDTPHDDWDFIIRLCKEVGAGIKTVPEVLAVYYYEEPRASLGQSSEWRRSLQWLDSLGPLVSRRAYSGFCLCVAGSRAASARDYAGFFDLLRRAFGRGAPRPNQIALFIGYWLIPKNLRRQLRAQLNKLGRAHRSG